MTNIVPLPIYPSKPTESDLAILKAAKGMVATTVLIKPVRAVPGSPGRIIALRRGPSGSAITHIFQTPIHTR